MSNYISEDKIQELEIKAIEELVAAGSGHTAGSLGMADIFTAFYFHILKHDPKKPDWEERDWLFLSNGHICPIRYVSMAQSGYFPIEELKTLRKLGTRLQGHPERKKLPGVESTSGPLGSGLGQACGVAYALRMDGKRNRVYCIMSDGEHDAGNTWESIMFAGKYKLSNLTGIIDRNNIQIDGATEDVMPLEPLEDKYRSFGWHVLHADGHNIERFIDAIEESKAIFEKPTIIIAHTIPGKGVDFAEFDYRWHGDPLGKKDVPGDPPKDKQVAEALKQLRTLGGKIKSEHQ